MSEVTKEDINTVLGKLKEIQPYLERWGEAPPPARATEEPSAVAAYEQMVSARQELIKMPTDTLYRMIAIQMAQGAKDGQGVDLGRWADRSAMAAMSSDGMVQKLLDTAGGTALIRQDLEPLLYAAFVKRFPWYDRINRKPSNGLVHAFNRIDALPTASFISDSGTVSDSNSTYTRATTNIAIAAVRVGTNLKLQYAVRAGGMGWNPETQEIQNGVTAITRKVQQALFQGNASVPGKVAADPEGLFDINGFDGLRIQVPAANISGPTSGPFLEAFNTLDGDLGALGAQSSIILMDARDRVKLMNELQPNMRYVNRVQVVPGLPEIEAINLGNSGVVPVLPIPGDEIGAYTSGGVTVRDAYLIDEAQVAMPWLGSESPTVLDIPVGVSGQLTHLFILFIMVGLEVAVPNFTGKLRIQ